MTAPAQQRDHLIEVGRRLPTRPDMGADRANEGPADLPGHAQIVVIGGGLIGLSIAWRLAQAGRDVLVIERGRVGDGASLASTGMLAAAAEYEPGGDILLPFALASQRMWTNFAAELSAVSKVEIDYDKSGTLLVAMTRDEVERLRARHALQLRAGLEARWLSGPEIRALEPGLRPNVSGGIVCPFDFQIDPRRLIPALRLAVEKSGGRVLENRQVDSLDTVGGVVRGVQVGDHRCACDLVILCAGAWSGRAGLWPGHARLPLRPLRGQALALRTAPAAPPIRHVIWTEQVHLAAKADGHLVVGATVEEAGFAAEATAGGVYALLEGARRALPSIEDMPIEAIWTGFRPTSDDDAPILGDCGSPGLVLAVGHHRNGVLLAPATAAAIAGLVINGRLMPEAESLVLARFGRGET